MSAILNIMNPDHPKKIAMIVANPATSEQTGWPIGFWWAELTPPYWYFTENGYQVDIFSPTGGKLEADAFSDPEHESSYSAHDIISPEFKKSKHHMDLINNTPDISTLDISEYDAVFLTGVSHPCIHSSIMTHCTSRLLISMSWVKLWQSFVTAPVCY